MNTSGNSARERGGCLSLYLILAFLGSVLGLVSVLTLNAANAALVAQGVTAIPGWYIPALVVEIILTLVAIYGMYTWKKWGVYLLVGTWVLSIAIAQAGGVSSVGTSIGTIVIEALVLWYVLRNKWALFEG